MFALHCGNSGSKSLTSEHLTPLEADLLNMDN